jgi:SAM-dependent methyltransferase
VTGPASEGLDPRRARSFGAVADEYDRWRPGYPDAAVDWLLPEGARTVADVGAGTGKLTGALLARGLRVIAVEPDPAMLAVLVRRHPAAEAHESGADALPLADGSVDAVLAGQAWHWFPHDRAAAEIRRVLRPGGWLGMAWNHESPVKPWQVELAALNPTNAGRNFAAERTVPEVVQVTGLPSEELEAAIFLWTEHVRPEDVRGRVATYSHIALMEPGQRERLLDEMAAVVAREAARQGTATVALNQQTLCVRWHPAR